MGVIEELHTRVTTLERRMDDHDDVHVRIEHQLGRLSSDVAQIKARVEVVPELQGGLVELRQMMAKVLARIEAGGGRS